MSNDQPIEHFVDRCIAEIMRGYRARNFERRQAARQALIDALRKQENRDGQRTV